MNRMKIISKAVTVKNAKLIEHESFYYVVHYDTTILKMHKESKEISIYLPVSNASRNAIDQALTYLNNWIEWDKRDQLSEKLNGVNIKDLRFMWKHKLYNMSNSIYKTHEEFKDQLTNEVE